MPDNEVFNEQVADRLSVSYDSTAQSTKSRAGCVDLCDRISSRSSVRQTLRSRLPVYLK
ncbi:hypothetical protein H6S82_02820 [Planktothrix sp. FACHB-1355]|uniref:Uncharacterized protein n=1 Tax=Aerosakkonema funiforme FACHB-1375 TaxID=2949571 RepID=A0A926ZEZ6_9CYAN|nr:hypothetical protein [Planktothrix sp. FACHB-1355]MBD2180144.1 hypothetical protein [Aerosakkonema funiforme FACHB-1375]MBD3557788.1 hypothetical protein [Planktothrix sp. FACHB-1355]